MIGSRLNNAYSAVVEADKNLAESLVDMRRALWEAHKLKDLILDKDEDLLQALIDLALTEEKVAEHFAARRQREEAGCETPEQDEKDWMQLYTRRENNHKKLTAYGVALLEAQREEARRQTEIIDGLS